MFKIVCRVESAYHYANWTKCTHKLKDVDSVVILSIKYNMFMHIRATSHTRLRGCDHCTSSTLIGGKGGAGPSSLHTTLEGPTKYVCECKMDVKST